MFKYNEFDISDIIVKNDSRYIVKDNTKLKNLVLSSTELNAGKKTSGHTHKGQEEIYFFIHGTGEMIVGDERFPVEEGDVILIPDGAFHQVINTQKGPRAGDIRSRVPTDNTLIFNCVFDGSRDQKKNFWDLVAAGIKNRLI
jgi:mannose-6-phosphate isomerase-like protein (cupin superfamily)